MEAHGSGIDEPLQARFGVLDVGSNRMSHMTAPVLWLLRRWTGYRPYHLLALVAALTVTLGCMGVAFWWLGEQAEAVAGPLGIALIALIYLYAAMLVLALAAVVVARLIIGRLRNSIGLSRPSWR